MAKATPAKCAAQSCFSADGVEYWYECTLETDHGTLATVVGTDGAEVEVFTPTHHEFELRAGQDAPPTPDGEG